MSNGKYFDLQKELVWVWDNINNPKYLMRTGLMHGAYFLLVIVWMTIFFVSILGAFVSNQPQNFAMLLPAIVGAYGFFIIGMAAIKIYFMPDILQMASSIAGLRPKRKKLNKMEYFVLMIRLMFVNMLSWYNLKYLIAPIALIIFGMISILVLGGDLGLFLGIGMIFLGITVWNIVMVLHSIRTNFATHMWARGDGHEKKMPRKSYGLVMGQTVEVFFARFWYGLVIFAVSMGVSVGTIFLGAVPIMGSLASGIISMVLSWFIDSFSIIMMFRMLRFFEKTAPAGKKK